MPKNLVVFLLPLLLFGCKAPQLAASRPPESKASEPVGSLINASMVEIENDWNGYSDITPIIRHYRLKMGSTGLAGDGHFAVGGYGGYNIHQQYSKKIVIPTVLSRQFLSKLAEAPLVTSRKYQPNFVRRDDFPRITIRVKAPDREVTFFSRSQGDKNAPWQVRVKKNQVTEYYVSDSPIPGLAMDMLKTQIDHPGLDAAISKNRSRSFSGRESIVPVKAASVPITPKVNTPK